jgi:hypothetical protein
MIQPGSIAKICYLGCFSFLFFASDVFIFSLTDVFGNLLSIVVHDERLSLMFRLEILGEMVESSFAFAQGRVQFLSLLLLGQCTVATSMETLWVTGIFLVHTTSEVE